MHIFYPYHDVKQTPPLYIPTKVKINVEEFKLACIDNYHGSSLYSGIKSSLKVGMGLCALP
jgi:hypothetical protein